ICRSVRGQHDSTPAAAGDLISQGGGHPVKWLNVILGLWVAVSPFVIGGSLQWSNVIAGIVIAVVAYMAMSAKT
ncbi:MAG TPA: SPW repeat protein, partial [bacterium]|nr:SPW repeat protein [bacterium]